MTVEHLLDLYGGDVLRIADDDVLEAPRDADVSGGIDRSEVPGVEPSLGIKRSLVERRIDISGEALWTSKEKLAFFPCSAVVSLRIDGTHRDTRRWPSDRRC